MRSRNNYDKLRKVSVGLTLPILHIVLEPAPNKNMRYPLESELQQQGINNLIFVLDEELRGLPVDSLYDGRGFIGERYTISKS